MASRWSNLPYSEQEQLYLAQTTTTQTPATTMIPMRKNIGGLIRQEVADSDQILCYYRNVANDSPIPYLCELGCCPNGCCAIQEISQSNSYGWAIALFFVLVFIIVFSSMAIFTLCYLNRQKNRQHRQGGLSSVDESVSGSQVSCPTSYYGQDGYYPYAPNVKAY